MIERRIGRALRSHEVVHHIDGNCCNNDPDNLLALDSQSAHVRVHMYQVREAQGLTHLFPLEVQLACCLDTVLWVSPVGAVRVFGKDAGALIAAEIQRRYRRPLVFMPAGSRRGMRRKTLREGRVQLLSK